MDVDIEDGHLALRHHLLQRLARRPVQVAVHLGMLQKAAGGYFLRHVLPFPIVIVHTILLAVSRLARRVAAKREQERVTICTTAAIEHEPGQSKRQEANPGLVSLNPGRPSTPRDERRLMH